MYVAGLIVDWALRLYTLLFVVRMALSWVPLVLPGFRPTGVVAVAFETVYTLTDPLIKFFRRFVPPLRLGGIALDVAFMLAFFVLLAVRQLSALIFFA